jgi:hypothetical protein
MGVVGFVLVGDVTVVVVWASKLLTELEELELMSVLDVVRETEVSFMLNPVDTPQDFSEESAALEGREPRRLLPPSPPRPLLLALYTNLDLDLNSVWPRIIGILPYRAYSLLSLFALEERRCECQRLLDLNVSKQTDRSYDDGTFAL